MNDFKGFSQSSEWWYTSIGDGLPEYSKTSRDDEYTGAGNFWDGKVEGGGRAYGSTIVPYVHGSKFLKTLCHFLNTTPQTTKPNPTANSQQPTHDISQQPWRLQSTKLFL